MRFEIVDKEGFVITDFNLEANPFKVGEIINISVNNYNKEFWSYEEVKGDYKIDNIEHYFSIDYKVNKNTHTRFCVSVEVTKLP